MKIGVGSVVQSKAGRDKGGYFIVIEVVDDNFVRISDGMTRPQERAKLKKIKHLKPNGEVAQKLADKLIAGKQVFDAELRSALRAYSVSNTVNSEEVQ